jgi:hypothetical protein
MSGETLAPNLDVDHGQSLPDGGPPGGLAIRLAGIEGGIECAKLAPLLSALADGEGGCEEVALLRPHLESCVSCRARVKSLRAAGGPSSTAYAGQGPQPCAAPAH